MKEVTLNLSQSYVIASIPLYTAVYARVWQGCLCDVFLFLHPSLRLSLPSSLPQIHSETEVAAVDGLHSLSAFGFSISSGVDVDGNSYNGVCVCAMCMCVRIRVFMFVFVFVCVRVRVRV